MTSVNVSTTTNQVLITSDTGTVVVEAPTTTVVTAMVEGPQGPPGNFALNDTAKVDKSLIYYDQASGSFKADNIWTADTIVDGANF